MGLLLSKTVSSKCVATLPRYGLPSAEPSFKVLVQEAAPVSPHKSLCDVTLQNIVVMEAIVPVHVIVIIFIY